MADVPVALLGYGTVGTAVNRLLSEQADDIERATGHQVRVVKALVRDLGKDRGFQPARNVLTDDVAEILNRHGHDSVNRLRTLSARHKRAEPVMLGRVDG